MPEPYSMHIPLLFALAVNIAVAVFIYFVFVRKDVYLGEDRLLAIIVSFMMALIPAVPAGIALDSHLRSQWEEGVWKYVHDTYPREKYDVLFVKIDPEVAGANKGFIATVPVWERDVVVTVVFRDGDQLVQHTNWHVRVEVATVQDRPQLEAMKVNEEVLGLVEPGYYDPVLYLPEDFEFH